MSLTVASGLFLLLIFRKKAELLKTVLVVLTFTLARIFFASQWKSLTGSVNTFVPSASFHILLLCNFLVLSLAFILAVNRLTNQHFSSLAWTTNNLCRNILIGLAAGSFLLFILTFNKTIELENLLPAAFFSFLIASWQEETVFRGYLTKYLCRKLAVEEALIYQALIYSSAHIGFYAFSPLSTLLLSLIFAFGLGLLFGYLRLATKSQLPAFIIHGMVDTAFLIIR
ncbi:MAG: CPBP family intramembrane glutamic endopeptidase [Planctomycetota bacterium]|jgi:membrane protease YdiL (CAAX protease family)